MFTTTASEKENKNSRLSFFHNQRKAATMKLIVSNVSRSLQLSLTVLRMTGFWWPGTLDARGKLKWGAFSVLSFFCLVGINLCTQAAELAYVFGDITRMTRILLILITNMTLVFKLVTIVWKMDKIHEIVDEVDGKLRSAEEDDEISIKKSTEQFTSWYLYAYLFSAFNTAIGMGAGARKPDFPLPARFPYDTTESPAYELTCVLQVVTLTIAAAVNISVDSLVSSLISQCCCRLKLLALALTKLCQGLDTTGNKKLSEEDENIALSRLHRCIQEHQAILTKTKEIQDTFSMPVFAQMTVSSFIICVTAYQLAVAQKTAVLLWSLLTYILAMMMQVFIYCYHGNELSVQSTEISVAAYNCLWYTCSSKLRRPLLILMIRSSREVEITVGGLTILSLATFTKVIKASYSFFMVLQSVQD